MLVPCLRGSLYPSRLHPHRTPLSGTDGCPRPKNVLKGSPSSTGLLVGWASSRPKYLGFANGLRVNGTQLGKRTLLPSVLPKGPWRREIKFDHESGWILLTLGHRQSLQGKEQAPWGLQNRFQN